MLNMNESKRYNPNEVLVLFRAIGKHLRTMPDAFQAQGVFRVSGAQQHIMQIINDILQHKKFAHGEYTVHDYVGALKYALINGNLLTSQDPAIQALKSKVAADDIAIGQSGIHEFIEKLASSEDKNQFMVAEIFYEFLRQLTATLALQDKNKMSSVNLGIIAGPFFANLIEDNPKRFLDTTLKLNQICAALISCGEFQASFESQFAKVVDAWREHDLIELESTRSQLLRQRETDKKKLNKNETPADDEKGQARPKATRKLFFMRKKTAAAPAEAEESSLLTKFHLRKKKK